MKAETLKALKGSIRKWQAIANGRGTDTGSDNCPLCILYWYGDPICDGCPVYKDTGKVGCDDTPYRDEWLPLFENGALRHRKKKKATSINKVAAAIAEVKYLKSLLPKTPKKKK